MYLPPDLMPGMEIPMVRMAITLDGKTYMSGKDIQADELQELLLKTRSFPTTSQPSAGDFAEIYRKLAATDPDILSIHMSSGLSGTVNAAKAGAEMVPEANVTIVDTKTLCAALGWQVAAAARALKAGWSKEKILALIQRIGDATESMYTLDELKYLIHGGRISHMKGLIASHAAYPSVDPGRKGGRDLCPGGHGAHLRAGTAWAGGADEEIPAAGNSLACPGAATLSHSSPSWYWVNLASPGPAYQMRSIWPTTMYAHVVALEECCSAWARGWWSGRRPARR